MLQIIVPACELFNEQTNEFIYLKAQPLTLEHSLVSLSKWEARWNKPFLTEEPKTRVEMADYVRCMTLTQNVQPDVYSRLSERNMKEVDAYLEAPMTATTIRDTKKGGRTSSQVVTSELIYYWMVSLNIPFECQKWHLNRLLTLIRVCTIKNGKDNKMSKRDIFKQNAALNAARRAKAKSKG